MLTFVLLLFIILISYKMQAFEALISKFKQSNPRKTALIGLIGTLVVLSKLVKLMRTLYKTIVRRPKNLRVRYGVNSWVFITGASQGIGRAFALEFARRGFNIILSARTRSKLENVQKQIKIINNNIQTLLISVDYKNSEELKFFDNIYSEVGDRDVSVLINNVGVDVLDRYGELQSQQILDLIKINCIPVSILSHHFINLFKIRKNKSAVINVSSVAGELPLGLHNAYSASKIYVDYLSRSISYEYPQIDIISLRPSQVSTPMTLNKKDIFTIMPDQCVRGLLNDLGFQKQSNGHWSHSFQSWLYSLVPEWLFNYIFINYVGKDFMNQRKQARQQK